MNQYFRRKSKKYREQLLVESYHFAPLDYNQPEPVVLVDLCNDVMRRDTVRGLETKIPEQKKFLTTFPAVKIARLGCNAPFAGKGAGTALLNALKIFFRANNRTGCRFLTVDAYRDREQFYMKSGFVHTLDAGDLASNATSVPLFFDLKTFDPAKTET